MLKMRITKVTASEVMQVKEEVVMRAKVRVEARTKMRVKVETMVVPEAPSLAILAKILQIRTHPVPTPKKMTRSPKVIQTSEVPMRPHDQIKIVPEF